MTVYAKDIEEPPTEPAVTPDVPGLALEWRAENLAPRTLAQYRWWLQRLDRELPLGLCRATRDELAKLLGTCTSSQVQGLCVPTGVGPSTRPRATSTPARGCAHRSRRYTQDRCQGELASVVAMSVS
jgi:hypothetical protein